MLLLSKARLNWLNLPSLSVLKENRPIFLYLFSKDKLANSEFFNIFSPENKVYEAVKTLGIECYSQDIAKLSPKFIDKFEVNTVPVVLGIFKWNKVGEVINDGNLESFMRLCDRMKHLSRPVESALVGNLRDLLTHGSPKDLRANVMFIRNNFLRELEADPTLFRLFYEASIVSHDDRSFDLKSLESDLQSLNDLLREIESGNSTEISKGRTSEDQSNLLNLITSRYLESNRAPLSELTSSNKEKHSQFGPEKLTLKKCYLAKMKILKLISVKQFMSNNPKESMQAAVDSYKLGVKLFNEDLCSLEEFKGFDNREPLESLFALLDPYDMTLLEARAELENILGKRNLNEIPVSQKPKGGVTKKRRGFGGRYIWQGMEYRPKKYKPRNLRQYLQEWRCVPDSNLPSFN